MNRAGRRPILALSLPEEASNDQSRLFTAVSAADLAGVDLLLIGAFGDDPAMDPLSLAAALVPATRGIGLVASIDAEASAPFHLARALASLDLLSGGRAGWLATFNPEGDGLAEDRFSEHLDVVCALFDSWEDDALVLDKESSVFADRRRVHRIDHRGRHFAVDGPLNAPRPIQGRPVVLQASAAVFAGYGDIALVDQDGDAANGLATLREVGVSFGRPTSGLWETPDALAAWMFQSLRQDDAAGFILRPVGGLGTFEQIVDKLMPALRRLGWPEPGEGADLRTRLGLARPANRFSPSKTGAAS